MVRSRSVLAGLAAVVLLLFGASAAMAAPVPIPASLSGVTASGQTVTGNLTLRPGSTAVDVDAASVKATIGGRPAQQVTVSRATAAESRTTLLVIDTSFSMGASGMAAVRNAVASFLTAVPADVLVGVVSFSNTAGVDLAPTTNHARVQQVVNGLSAGGNTALYSAIKVASAALTGNGDRSLILLSDGGDSKLTGSTLQQAVAAISSAKVRAEVIRFKTDETNDANLRAIAAAGGSAVTPATNAAAVSAAFSAAARALESQVQWSAVTSTPLGAKQPVVLTGTASGRPFTASGVVDFGAVTPPPTSTSTPAPTTSTPTTTGGVGSPTSGGRPRSSSGGGISWSWTLVWSLLAVFLGLFGLVVAFVSPVFRSQRSLRVSAIDQYAAGTLRPKEVPRHTNPSVVAEQLIHMGDRVMASRESTSGTMELMDRADLPWRAGEWFVLRIISVIAGGAIGLLLLRNLSYAGLLVGAFLGFVLPAVGLRFLARRRHNKFEALLPDILMLVATSLSSGFSLPQSLDAVARDSAEPGAKEFSRALAETRIGADMADALDHLAIRMNSENMRWTTMAIRIQRDVGGNLAETLRTTAKTLRERESLGRQVRALSAEGRLSAYILIALPILVLFYSVTVNYGYVSLLWQGQLGILMLVGAAIDMIIGIFWMRKVVQIEV